MIIRDERAVLEKQAAHILAGSIKKILGERSTVTLAVPGGRSVANVLQHLEREPVDWSRVHFFMVDERLVPAGHADSNFKLVASCVESFADTNNLHPFPLNSANHQAALESYNKLLFDHGGRLDIVLLSSGEDGHIASLFPDHESMSSDEPSFILVDDAPKPPAARVSASKTLIASARSALLLFFGKEKQIAFNRYQDQQVTIERCPAKIVSMIDEHYILTDMDC